MLENVEKDVRGACRGESVVEHGIGTQRDVQNDDVMLPTAPDLSLGGERHE